MKQLIDKSAVVEEIEKRLSLLEGGTGHPEVMKRVEGVIKGYKSILSFLDTLEVKEVDLEKEIELVKGDYEQVDVAWNDDFDFIARHFYELGLKSKGE